jgi:modulator of FtsH protease HflK
MPWTNQSGGGGGPWGGGQSPWGRPSQGPKVEDIIKRSQDKLRSILPGGFGSRPGLIIIVIVALALWALSGFYQVQPDELGVVLRFGAVDRIAFPGLRYHIPAPVESVERPKVTRVNRVEIGFRLGDNGRTVQDLPRESLMLTGDENIVDINFTVFWVIKDAQKYLFNIRDPDATVKAAAESAMREVIGHTEIASAFAEGRAKIEIDTQKLLQEILDYYDSGIDITQLQLQKVDPPPPVIEAFRDVQSAKIDFTRFQNEADAYQNDVVPQAQGEAARIVQEAEAYKAQIVNQAQGDAQRFISVYNAYAKAPDVTARRLYIDTMQTILKSANKIILDRAASSSGVLPYLPLPQIKGASPSTAGRAPAAGGSPPSVGSARP